MRIWTRTARDWENIDPNRVERPMVWSVRCADYKTCPPGESAISPGDNFTSFADYDFDAADWYICLTYGQSTVLHGHRVRTAADLRRRTVRPN